MPLRKGLQRPVSLWAGAVTVGFYNGSGISEWERRGAMKEDLSTQRMTVKNILFATDFSAVSRRAFHYARGIACHYGSTIIATHVIPPEEYFSVPPEVLAGTREVIEKAAREEMQLLGKSLGDVPHKLVLRDGEIWDALLGIIRTVPIDLAVLGTRGRKGLERLLLGSIAEEIFRLAPCPVLTVGQKAEDAAPETGEFTRILCAVDFTPSSEAMVPFAVSIAGEYQARVTLLHVLPAPEKLPGATAGIVADVAKRLSLLLPAEVNLSCKPECEVRLGEPGAAILEEGQKGNTDLIVLGVRRFETPRGAISRVSATIAHAVVGHACCPVLTVRDPAPAAAS
jgi:nucleotide-binding universal stress UspA family protein